MEFTATAKRTEVESTCCARTRAALHAKTFMVLVRLGTRAVMMVAPPVYFLLLVLWVTSLYVSVNGVESESKLALRAEGK